MPALGATGSFVDQAAVLLQVLGNGRFTVALHILGAGAQDESLVAECSPDQP
ncbi:hypothetical protein D3C80_2100750 [compost metagenome]